ncbi:MAG: ZIP family metal transporter [Candidatus Micrarchaeia archaeon]
MSLLYILASAIAVSLISLVGVALLSLRKATLGKVLPALVSFAAGTLLGAAFLDLLPEAQAALGNGHFALALLGVIAFFAIEKLLRWYHCHDRKCRVHEYAYMNLLGDGIHNFLDGAIIAVAYLADFATGVTATIAVAAHEIPQEIGDFSILLKGGFTKREAILYNFATALTAVVGAVAAYFLAQQAQAFTTLMLPFAAGGFIYIAGADLFPELHKTGTLKESLTQLAFILIGVCVIAAAHAYMG